jgi:hypothetical protein
MSTLQPYANNIYLEWAVGKTTPPALATLYLTFTDKLFSLGGVEVMAGLIGSANRIALTPAIYFTQPAVDSKIQNNVNINVTTNCPTTTSVTFGAASVHDSNFPGAHMIAETAVQPRTLYNGDWLIILVGGLNFSIG